MNVEVAPCDGNGREYTETEDMFVDSPEEMVGREVNFVFKISDQYDSMQEVSNAFVGRLVGNPPASSHTKEATSAPRTSTNNIIEVASSTIIKGLPSFSCFNNFELK